MARSKPVKIFDTTVLIAFLEEMGYPEGVAKLAKDYRIIVPQGVASEVTKPPGRCHFQRLVRQKSIDVVRLSDEAQALATLIMDLHMQLHRGECEAIALAQTEYRQASIVSDDKRARKRFKEVGFEWTREILDAMEKNGSIDSSTHAEKIARLDRSSFY